jgi:hypothetical protein
MVLVAIGDADITLGMVFLLPFVGGCQLDGVIPRLKVVLECTSGGVADGFLARTTKHQFADFKTVLE